MMALHPQHRLPHASRSRNGKLSHASAVAPAAAVQVARSQTAMKRRFLTMPAITFSSDRTTVDPAELALLLRAAEGRQLMHGSSQQQGMFQHWSQAHTDAKVRRKLQTILDNSVAIVAVFTRDTSGLYADQCDEITEGRRGWDSSSSSSSSQADCDKASTSGRSAESNTGVSALKVLRGSWPLQRPRQRLVGFVRAAGDGALVATVHDLAIHPHLQGYGLGAKLLRSIVNQVTAMDITDIGLTTPVGLKPFFSSCSWEPDREQSIPMALCEARRRQLLPPGALEEVNADVASNGALRKILNTALDGDPLAYFTY